MIKKFRSIIAKRLPIIGKAFIVSAFIFLLFAVVILSIPHQALAQTGILSDPVVWLQNQIAHLILLLAKWIGDLTLTLIGLLVDVAKFNNFIYAPAVEKGWVIVRDICNMFFIVILLLIAFGSVFRIEEYQYKKILGKLLIMAVLINFSKTICGFFIDVAQVVMLTFVNGFKEAAAGNFIVGFHLTDIFQFSARAEGDPPVEGTAYLAAAAMALITIVITAIVVGIYLVILLLRIIAIWFLVIISPVAYALSAFPGDAKKYSSQWWDYFGKYVTTGPILAFFLWLSLAVMQMDTSAASYGFVTSETQGTIPAATITNIGSSEVLLSFIINIMLLIGGLWMAQQLGVAGGKLAGAASSKIQNVGNWAMKAPFKAPFKAAIGAVKAPGSWAARQYSERMPVWMNPIAMRRGYLQRKKQLHDEATRLSTARGRTLVTKVLTRGQQIIPYDQIESGKIEAGYISELGHLPKEQTAAVMRRVWNMGGPEGDRIRSGLLSSAASEGHIDDLLDSDFIRHEAEWQDANGARHRGFEQPDGTFSSYERINQLMYSVLSSGKNRGAGGLTQDAMSTMYDIGDLGKKIGHLEYYGHDGFDSVNNSFINRRAGVRVDPVTGRDLNLEEASDEAIGEYVKFDQQKQLQFHPHNWQVQKTLRDAAGNTVGQWGQEDPYIGRKAYDVAIAGAPTNEVLRRSTTRLGYLLGSYNTQAETYTIDPQMLASLQRRWNISENSRDNLRQLYSKMSAQHINLIDNTGNTIGTFNGDDALDLLALDPVHGAGFHPPPMRDIDKEKQARTSKDYEEFITKPENRDKDFFGSAEYTANKDKYYSKEEYFENIGFQRWQSEHSGGLSVNSFARGQANEIAVDFTKLNLPQLEGKAGVNLNSQQDIVAAAQAIAKVIDDEIKSLEAKSDRTQGDNIHLGYLKQAQEKINNPEQINNLSLYNTARSGIGGKRLITHEDQHAALAAIDPNESIQRNIWEKMHTEQERKQIIEQVRNKQGAPEMTEDEARREYFAEGLANETQWGDKSSDAIRLKKGTAEEFNKAIENINIDSLTNNTSKKTESSSKPKPQVAVGKNDQAAGLLPEVKLTLQNELSLNGGFDAMHNLSSSPLAQERLFAPVIRNLKNQFTKTFSGIENISSGTLQLRDKLMGKLDELDKSLKKSTDVADFQKKFGEFINEFGGETPKPDETETDRKSEVEEE